MSLSTPKPPGTARAEEEDDPATKGPGSEEEGGLRIFEKMSHQFEQWSCHAQSRHGMLAVGTGFWSQAEDAKKKLEEEANKTEQD